MGGFFCMKNSPFLWLVVSSEWQVGNTGAGLLLLENNSAAFNFETRI
jgi:hypothetical protein